jgi:hypothetical protein
MRKTFFCGVDPIMDKVAPPCLDDLCHKYRIKDPATASNMIVTAKRRFHTAMRNHGRGCPALLVHQRTRRLIFPIRSGQ